MQGVWGSDLASEESALICLFILHIKDITQSCSIQAILCSSSSICVPITTGLLLAGLLHLILWLPMTAHIEINMAVLVLTTSQQPLNRYVVGIHAAASLYTRIGCIYYLLFKGKLVRRKQKTQA